MTNDQREAVARAIYEAYVLHITKYILNMSAWPELQESTREMYRCMADAAYSAINGEGSHEAT